MKRTRRRTSLLEVQIATALGAVLVGVLGTSVHGAMKARRVRAEVAGDLESLTRAADTIRAAVRRAHRVEATCVSGAHKTRAGVLVLRTAAGGCESYRVLTRAGASWLVKEEHGPAASPLTESSLALAKELRLRLDARQPERAGFVAFDLVLPPRHEGARECLLSARAKVGRP